MIIVFEPCAPQPLLFLEQHQTKPGRISLPFSHLLVGVLELAGDVQDVFGVGRILGVRL